MGKFIRSLCEGTKHNDLEYINNPINLSLVVQISMGRVYSRKDDSFLGLPAIRFYTTNGMVEWVYPIGREDLRDADYGRILNSEW